MKFFISLLNADTHGSSVLEEDLLHFGVHFRFDAVFYGIVEADLVEF